MTLRHLALLGTLLGALGGLSACSSAGLLNAVTSKADYAVTRGIRYGEGARGTYDLYVPAAVTPTSPVLVFSYGGSWDAGSKDLYLFVGQSLASEGVVVAVPDYRVYPEVTFPGFVEDSARAVAAVAAAARTGEDGIPAGRHPLFLMGHSAGAEIAALLALDTRYLTAAGLPQRPLAGFIGLAGPYDFLPLTEERYKRIFPEASRAASQPVNFVGGRMPPMLLVAGTADTTVNPKNTLSLAGKVRAAGGSVRSALYPGVDHIGALSALATALPAKEGRIRASVLAFIRDHS